jgi:hypothetical protein
LLLVKKLSNVWKYLLKGALYVTVSSSESATTNVEQEKFFNSVVQATPSAFLKTGSSAWGMTESTLSIDSMLTSVDTDLRVHGTTPEQSRKSSNPFSKVMAGTLG